MRCCSTPPSPARRIRSGWRRRCASASRPAATRSSPDAFRASCTRRRRARSRDSSTEHRMGAAPPPAAWGVYLVTDRQQTNNRPLVEVVAAALDGGIRAVQLRERDLPTRALLALAEALRALTRRYAAALLINDRVDVALACDADGVHLPADSFAVADARALL